MNPIWTPNLVYVQMKADRAKVHLDALELELGTWLKRPPYTIVERDYFDKARRDYCIQIDETPQDIPLLVGDFVCCIRSALDQLAWNLAHIDRSRIFSAREERDINFPIFTEPNSNYIGRRKLFPSAVADVFDAMQPYLRGPDACRDHPLWQLNELWRLDKHRTIPANCNVINIDMPDTINWQSMKFDDCFVVSVPLIQALTSPVELKPRVSVKVLFGEHMGVFEVSASRLREIYDVVTNNVIPRFAGFFS